MRKTISLLGAAAVALGFSTATVAADAYPSKPITLVVPWGAGGSVDMTARKIGEVLAQQGFNIVVDNVPGASGTIGLRRVATSQPDGYTLGIATTSLMGAIAQKITPLTTADFTPLVQMTAEQEVLLVPDESPVKTIEDFVELMKTKQGGVSFGTPGAYTVNHVYGELLAQAVGEDMIHVPYGGGAKVLADLTGRQIDAGILKPSEAKALVDSGRIRPIGAFATERSEMFPDVPTFEEKGLDLFVHGDLPLLSYIAGPKDLPENVVLKLTKAFSDVVVSEEYASFAREYGMTGSGMKGEELHAVIQVIQDAYDSVLPNITAK